MKPITAFLILLAFTHFSYAQNVGVGTDVPSEKLDVNGNINVSGTIKANGADGLPNQVLMKNGNGTLAWGDLSDYKNMATFTTTGAGNWTVPAGVTRIAAEAWGAGGGGNAFGGGGGGGYVRGIFTVVPGTVISFTIGQGGSGSLSNANDGINTNVSVNGIDISGAGGSGATTQSTGVYQTGAGGGWSFPAGFTNCFGMTGDQGDPNRVEYQQRAANTFIEISYGGDGGDGGNSHNTRSKGGSVISTVSPNTSLRNTVTSAGKLPGGGGSGGHILFSGGTFVLGKAGGGGMVSIHY